MPKSVKKELAKKILHPKSRKALQLTKQTKKISSRDKVKLVHQVKQNLLGEKVQWFRDHLVPDIVKYTPELTMNIIELYLGRFQEELEQIGLKHSVGNRKNRQHASREDIIRLTLLRDEEEFATCGLEIPDLMNSKQLEVLRNWNGELRFLQNFKLKRFSRKILLQMPSSTKSNQEKSELDNDETLKKTELSTKVVSEINTLDTQRDSKSVISKTKVSTENKIQETNDSATMDVDN